MLLFDKWGLPLRRVPSLPAQCSPKLHVCESQDVLGLLCSVPENCGRSDTPTVEVRRRIEGARAAVQA